MTYQNYQTTNFVYFTLNFPYEFILTIFGDTVVGNHLQSKFNFYCEKNQNSALAVLSVFTEMSQDNQEVFLNWINENYCYSKSALKGALFNELDKAENNTQFEIVCNLIPNEEVRKIANEIVWHSMTLEEDKKVLSKLIQEKL